MKKKSNTEEAATWVGVEDLRRWEENPRKNKAAISHVAESIERFGFASPIIAREEDNMIIAGHTRYEAALKLGLKSVPVRYMDLSKADSKLLALADNKTAEIAEWDEEELEKVLQSLVDEGHNVEGLGWDEKELQELIDLSDPTEKEEAAPPEVREDEEPISQLGEIYQLGEHRLICGDSTDPATWEKLMQGEKANMVFTDPPYGMFLDTDYSEMQAQFENVKSHTYKRVKGDGEDFNPRFISIYFELFPYCKEMFFWGADYYAELLPDRNKGSWVVWDKRDGENLDKMYGSMYELCWSRKKHRREIARVLWSGLFGMGMNGEDKKRLHPTHKPIRLAEWFFSRYGKEGDIVVDGFAGSGYTLIASQKTNRKARLVEIEPMYCDVIRRRWAEYAAENNLDIGDGLDG